MSHPGIGPQSPQLSISPRVTRFVGLYCLVLLTLYNLAAAGLIGVPVQFILKNQLHLQPTQVSVFGFLTDGPYFIGFAFGFLRDRWRPFGKGDTGYFLFVPLLMGLVYVVLGYVPHTYGVLVAGLIVLAALSSLLGAAAQGLVAAIAKDFGMMGRLSVVSYMTYKGALVYQQSVGGWLDEHSSHVAPFLVSGAVCVSVLLMAFWHPRVIFRSGKEVFVSVIPEGATAAFKRLLRHKAVYIPALVLFLWDFAPGWGTPLLFYLTNVQKLTESEFGASQGWLRLGQVLAALCYAGLCTRFKFKPLLYWGTFLGVIGGPTFLLIHSPGQANIVCLIAGASCGIAVASYYDLLFRCCPKELEGVAFMVSYAAFTLAGDASDILGSFLYEKGGFGLALAISMAFTALIYVPLIFLPRSATDPHEGEAIVDVDPPRNLLPALEA
jgi:MFS family permease